MTEQQLQKALSAANDLEPPTDDLFAERALQRGRARTARRRNALVGAAAGVALVAVLGGTWMVQSGTQGVSTSAGARAQSAEDSAGGAGGPEVGLGATGAGSATPTGPVEVPGQPGVLARNSSGWVSGRVTEQTAALEELVPTLSLNFPDVFGGAYATDASNTHIVVTLTRHHAELEALVSSLMPDPSNVSFEIVKNTALRKQEVAAKVVADAPQWRAKGITIVAVRLDAKADRVTVVVREKDGVSAIEQEYGTDIVRAEVGAGPALGGTVTEPVPEESAP